MNELFFYAEPQDIDIYNYYISNKLQIIELYDNIYDALREFKSCVHHKDKLLLYDVQKADTAILSILNIVSHNLYKNDYKNYRYFHPNDIYYEESIDIDRIVKELSEDINDEDFSDMIKFIIDVLLSHNTNSIDKNTTILYYNCMANLYDKIQMDKISAVYKYIVNKLMGD